MMNVQSLRLRWKESYRKNAPGLWALMTRRYPRFVFESLARSIDNEVPVFVFHDVKPDIFEETLNFLSRNDYHTIVADEFARCLRKQCSLPPRTVVLTFDDGWRSLWSVAFPLLKQYGMRAVAFINPGLVSAHEQRQAPLLCTWTEIREMHDSGVVDFQSHTVYHNQTFISPTIEYFVHPKRQILDYGYCFVFRQNGADQFLQEAQWGTPIYQYTPRMVGCPRYVEDEDFRLSCTNFVKESGNEEFFDLPDWQQRLNHHVREYRHNRRDRGRFESSEQTTRSIRIDLEDCKQLIEQHLPGKVVQHFCFPFYLGSRLAVDVLKETGYESAHWGTLKGRRSNSPGDDPFYTPRLGSEFIFRLPGRGRKRLATILGNNFSRNLPRILQR